MKFKLILITSLIITGCFMSCKKEEIKTPEPENEVAAQTRVYYIAAVEQEWDYAPQGKNVFTGMDFDSNDSVYTVNSNTNEIQRIGRKYVKARYIEYTDSTFTTPKDIAPEWEHLGILGPVIRANVEDSVLVYFKNKTTINTSLHVHGLQYDVNSEGAPYNNGATSGATIAPNESYLYKYYAREESGPSDSQGSSNVWVYHTHVNMDESDMYAGLMGAIIVNKKGMGDENAHPIDIDREFVTLFMVINENSSSYINQNITTYLPGFTNPNPDDFEESNKKHTINGMLMGNLPGLDMKRGERVRWYVLDLGNEVDLHTPHWHGNVVNFNGQYTDVLELLPANMLIANMRPYNVGTWAFHCHVTDHMMAGMTALYNVTE
ncbi:MAG: multicopper oxidase domain-containing protein [Flavobacteriia bacterium]|nr:multicopper oxidase domain-containing protein [Flavobacteriia bacterium]